MPGFERDGVFKRAHPYHIGNVFKMSDSFFEEIGMLLQRGEVVASWSTLVRKENDFCFLFLQFFNGLERSGEAFRRD